MTLTVIEQEIVEPDSSQEFTEVSWTPNHDLTFDEWMERGETFSQIHRSIHFWIGDWVIYGERKWGEKYAQALDSTHFTYGTLRNDAFTADRIPPEIRRKALYWNHHYLAACVTTDVRLLDRFLAKVERRMLNGQKATTSWFRQFLIRFQTRYCGLTLQTMAQDSNEPSFLPLLPASEYTAPQMQGGFVWPSLPTSRFDQLPYLFAQANQMKRRWRKRAIKAEQQLAEARNDNAELYNEIVELQKSRSVFGKRDWMAGVLK